MSDPRESETSLDEQLGEDAAEEEAAGEVPAGGAGADSGAVGTVRVDPRDDADIPDRSPHNDEPGVGTRGPSDDASGA